MTGVGLLLSLPLAAKATEPVVNAGPDQVVDERTRVAFLGSAIDPDGLPIISVRWTQIDGPHVALARGNSVNPFFDAPSVEVATVLNFQMEATDLAGETGRDFVSVTVRNIDNTPPNVGAGADKTVDEGASVTLDGAASDPDGDNLSLAWTQISGPAVTIGNANAAQAVITAPQVAEATVLTFRLTASDGRGGVVSDDMNVTVNDVPPVNHPPSVSAGPDKTIDEGTSTTLDGAVSDPDGDALTILWTQTGGPAVTIINGNTPQATITAPQVAAATPLAFRLTATDPGGLSTSDDVLIVVNDVPPPNRPPSADAGPDQTVTSGAVVTLTGAGTDPDNDPITFSWTQTLGPIVALSGANSSVATFVAPIVNVNTVFRFRLTVTDAGGLTAADPILITVSPPVAGNQNPLANAGTDQTVLENAPVQLAGSGSDPDGDPITLSWQQTGGPVAVLVNPESPNPTFVAPAVDNDSVLRFTLTVSDNRGGRASDDVLVTVKNNDTVNPPPTANAGPDQEVGENSVVTLDGSGSTDPSNELLTFQWVQIGGPAVALTDPAAVQPVFTTPLVSGDTLITFQLTVRDPAGNAASDQITVTVRNVAGAGDPVASAGISGFLIAPNPFNPNVETAQLRYTLDDNSDVTIVITDLLGILVREMRVARGQFGGSLGDNRAEWDGKNGQGDVVGNGGYVVHLSAVNSKNSRAHAVEKAAVLK
jgi:hypothetical protein